jgi:hypothetical protein
MIYFNNPFNLPGPKELGMSDSDNAMPSSLFPNYNDERPTWEMYYERLKQDYPVKFFLSSTLPDTLLYAWRKTLGWKLRDGWWWFQSFIIRKDHILDLRQPSKDKLSPDYYRHGWIETDTKIVLALFTLLDQFMDGGLPIYCPSDEEAEKDDGKDYNYAGMKRQREQCLEIIAIHNWWKVERKHNLRMEEELLNKWSDAHHKKLPETENLWKELQAKRAQNEQEEDDMIARLMKIRRCLWS